MRTKGTQGGYKSNAFQQIGLTLAVTAYKKLGFPLKRQVETFNIAVVPYPDTRDLHACQMDMTSVPGDLSEFFNSTHTSRKALAN